MKRICAVVGALAMALALEDAKGLLGAGLAVLCLWQLFVSLTSQLPASLGILAERAQLQFLAPDSLLLLVGLGWVMGTLGSLLSLRRFLKRW